MTRSTPFEKAMIVALMVLLVALITVMILLAHDCIVAVTSGSMR